MPIIVRLDKVMADRKIMLKDLADEVGISNVNLSKLKKLVKLSLFAFLLWKRFVRHWIVSLETSWSIKKKNN